VTWWALAAFALGVVYGSLTQSIEDFIGDNPAMEKLLAALGGASLTDSYLATSLLILALLATGPALQIVQRLRTEETETRAEMVLATGTSRPRWITSHLAVALGAGALALVLGGFGLGLADAAVGGDAGEVPRLVGAALAYVPAVWLLTGLGVALFGLLPRWTAAGWVALTACLVIAMFGELLDLPTWVRDLSPFQHTPAAPAADLRGLPLAVLSTTAAAMIALGLASFRHRDIATA
jgi:ABC-2 type transport system permease protein